MLTALFLYQVGYSTGRVPVLLPVGAITATLPPMLFAVLARAETTGGERLPGVALLDLGGLLLSWRRNPGPADKIPRSEAARAA